MLLVEMLLQLLHLPHFFQEECLGMVQDSFVIPSLSKMALDEESLGETRLMQSLLLRKLEEFEPYATFVVVAEEAEDYSH